MPVILPSVTCGYEMEAIQDILVTKSLFLLGVKAENRSLHFFSIMHLLCNIKLLPEHIMV